MQNITQNPAEFDRCGECMDFGYLVGGLCGLCEFGPCARCGSEADGEYGLCNMCT
jgi:hypothetical protein